MLLRYFVNFYDMEIIEEEAFLAWKEDITQEFPGKGKALFQVRSRPPQIMCEQFDVVPAGREELTVCRLPSGQPVAHLAGDGGGGGVRGRSRLRNQAEASRCRRSTSSYYYSRLSFIKLHAWFNHYHVALGCFCLTSRKPKACTCRASCVTTRTVTIGWDASFDLLPDGCLGLCPYRLHEFWSLEWLHHVFLRFLSALIVLSMYLFFFFSSFDCIACVSFSLDFYWSDHFPQ